MASSKDAFSKLEMWKKSKTVLRLTVYERGAEDHFTGSIFHVDFGEQTVGFVVIASRTFLPPLDLTDADFVVEPFRVEASDPQIGKVVFEEVRTV